MFRKAIEVKNSIQNYALSTRLGKKLQQAIKVVVYYLVGGDLWQAISKEETFSEEFKRDKFKSFGVFGNIAHIQCTSEKVLGVLLDQLDKQPKGRKSYELFAEFTGGPIFFAESTTASSMAKRKQLTAYFNPHHFANLTTEYLAETQRGGLIVPEASELVRSVLARKLFGLKRLPENSQVVCDEIDKQLEELLDVAIFPKLPLILDEEYENAKADFKQFTNALLEMQMGHIMQAIDTRASDTPTRNLTADTILELMRQDKAISPEEKICSEKVRAYFARPAVQSISGYFVALGNISRVLAEGIKQFYKGEEFLKMLSLMISIQAVKELLAEESLDRYFSMYSEKIKAAKNKIASELSAWFDRGEINEQLFKEWQDNGMIKIQAFNLWMPDQEELQHELEKLKLELRSMRNDLEEMAACIEDKGQINPERLKISKVLDRYYRASLEISTPSSRTISRYLERPMTIDGRNIPGNTRLVIDLSRSDPLLKENAAEEKTLENNGSQASKPARFFSAGNRSCPGFMVAEYMFKAVIADLARRTLSFVNAAGKSLILEEEKEVSHSKVLGKSV